MSWVITVDGASGSGKTALASAIADKLNAPLLPSGLLYRLVALWQMQGIVLDNMPLTTLHSHLKIMQSQDQMQVIWRSENITGALMEPRIAEQASIVAQSEAVRYSLLDVQRAWPAERGLVAEGRDMGSVIFPDATIKWFVTCDIETRAKRRMQQLLGLGIHAKFDSVVQEILARDLRDQHRDIAPLQKPVGAICIENVKTLKEQVDEMVRVSLLRIGAYHVSEG